MREAGPTPRISSKLNSPHWLSSPTTLLRHPCLLMFLIQDLLSNTGLMPLLGHLCLAALLGCAIGCERLISGQTAGIRTHMLVSTGAALFTIISMKIGLLDGAPRIGDPARIAAQVVSGIGFLGAGTIIHSGLSTKGLTTSACLWMVAALGMACAVGLHAIAVIMTIIILAALTIFKRLERNSLRRHTLTLQLKTRTLADLEELRRAIGNLPDSSVRTKTLTHCEGYTEADLTLSLQGIGTQAEIPRELVQLMTAHQEKILSYDMKCN